MRARKKGKAEGGVYLVRPSGTMSCVPWCWSVMWFAWWSHRM